MIKKTITYKDYDGEVITEDFYFNLSKPELVKLDAFYGGLQKRLDKVKADRDYFTLYEMFENIIKSSYGVKSEDRKRFVKSNDISDSFLQSRAYEVLFNELIVNEEAINDFMSKVAETE